jgi:hypothetical protein
LLQRLPCSERHTSRERAAGGGSKVAGLARLYISCVVSRRAIPSTAKRQMGGDGVSPDVNGPGIETSTRLWSGNWSAV